MVTAQATGARVEDTSERTEYTRVYANPDGTWTNETASGPESVRDDDGQWQDIDTTLVEQDGVVVPTMVPTDLQLSDGGDRVFASMSREGQEFGWHWRSTLPTPILDGSSATYPNAVDGGDLVITATPNGFTHSIILRQRPDEPVEISIPITTDGGDLVAGDSGDLKVTKSDSNAAILRAPAPIMWDSSDSVDGELGSDSEPVATEVSETTNGTPQLTLTPDADYLSDPATVYPVTVDPSFTFNTTNDTWVSNTTTTSQQSATDLRVGVDGSTKYRSFLRFNSLVGSIPTNADITDATLLMRNFQSFTCNTKAIAVARITEDWLVSSLTWGAQPAVTGPSSVTSAAGKGYDDSCPSGDATWDAKAIVSNWANTYWSTGSSDNWGLRVKADDETVANSYRRYRSLDYGGATSLIPHINVTYNRLPGTPGAPTIVTSPASNSGYSTSATPTFRSKVSDLDGSHVRAVFRVYLGTTLKWTGTSSYVSSGEYASVKIPAGYLYSGSTYGVTAQADDGTDVSVSVTAKKTFTVDTDVPGTNIVASDYTNNQWSSTTPTSNTFTFYGPSDTTTFLVLKDGSTSSQVVADSNGDATFAWAPSGGAHSLRVVAADKAGNAGSAATFSFGVGVGSMSKPTQDLESTGRVPVLAAGAPGAASASLSWRVAGASAWNAASAVTDTSSGSAWSGSVTSTGSTSTTPSLRWNAATETLPGTSSPIKAPLVLELRVCFNYSSSPSQVCSTERRVQLVQSAFGENFPTTRIGDLDVALSTGESTMSATDVSDESAGIGRTFSSYDVSTLESGPFGPGWTSSVLSTPDSPAELIDHRAVDRTFVVVTAGNGSQVFRATDASANLTSPTGVTTFAPLGTDDGSRITMSADGLRATLMRPFDTTTTWEYDNTISDWVLDSTEAVSGTGAKTSISSSGGYVSWIAETRPGVSATCTETVQDPGCRGLKVSYTGSGSSRRVDHIERRVSGATSATVTTYQYDSAGRLAQVCSPDPDGSGAQAALCTVYTYTTSSTSGRALLASYTPPGQATWTYAYDSSDRFVSATRPTPTDVTVSGDAQWKVDYSLSVGDSGLPDLSAGASSVWGQTDVPSKVTAVYSPTGGSSASVTDADLWYMNDAGWTTNTAVRGNIEGDASARWLMDASWYDVSGNVVRYLDYNGLAAAQGDSADGPRISSLHSTYTRFSSDGQRVEDEFGPAHEAVLADGTSGEFRTHTAYAYDDEAPSLGGGSKPAYGDGETSFYLVVGTDTSTSDADMVSDFDIHQTRNSYAPVVSGDANGWTLGIPTQTLTKMANGSWQVTTTTRYDAQGRTIETRQAGGATNSDGSGSDAQSQSFSYYSSDNSDSDCTTVGHPERAPWIGQRCKIRAIGSGASVLPVTWAKEYSPTLHPTVSVETGASANRTTTIAYDSMGREISGSVASGGTSLSLIWSYDSATGLLASKTSAGATVSSTYDAWGRTRTYTDASGLVTTSTYTIDGSLASVTNSQGSTTYNYAATDHRDVPATMNIAAGGSSPGTVSMVYNANGDVTTQTLPNGVSVAADYDESGIKTSQIYNSSAGGSLIASQNTYLGDGKILESDSTGSQSAYAYDALGRLTTVQDLSADGCRTRTYTFNDSTERTNASVYAPASDYSCQRTTATSSRSWTYDAANRISNSGYVYDSLGRVTTVPKSDTSAASDPDASVLAIGYLVSGQVSSLSQAATDSSGVVRTNGVAYEVDPMDRTLTSVRKVDGVETSRTRYSYSDDDSDSATAVATSADGGSTWTTTRYVALPGTGVLVEMTGSGLSYDLPNLHGDLMARSSDATGTTIDAYTDADEYGIDQRSNSARYSYLGSTQRTSGSDLLGGLIIMGSRLYNPATGTFTSPDPILNGNPTRYGYPADPVGHSDPSGMVDKCHRTNNWDCPQGWISMWDYDHIETVWYEADNLRDFYGFNQSDDDSVSVALNIAFPYAEIKYFRVGYEVWHIVQRSWVHKSGNDYIAYYRIKTHTALYPYARMRTYFIGTRFWVWLFHRHMDKYANYGTTHP